MRELAVVVPFIRTDFIKRCLETFRAYTKDAYVIAVDQTPKGMYDQVKDKVDLYLKPNRNLGFSKAANEGIIHAKRWGVPYIGVLNDDTEAMYPDWFEGIKEEFATDPNILCVNPESPRIPLWGYGRVHGEKIDVIPYKQIYTPEDIAYLKAGNYHELVADYDDIPPAFPLQKRGVIDAIAMWFPIFKNEFFDKVGYFDEKFYPGGGEDYDLNARGYSRGYRLVSSMKSWYWHHWGQSKDRASEFPSSLQLFDTERRWNNNDYLWPPDLSEGHHMDPWGHYTNSQGQKTPYQRIDEVHVEPL